MLKTKKEKYTKTKCLNVFSNVSFHFAPLWPAAPFLFQPVDIFYKILKPGRLLDDNVNQDQADDGYGNQDINQSKQNQN